MEFTSEDEERQCQEELTWIVNQFVAKNGRKPKNTQEFEEFWNELVKNPKEIPFGIA
jgi:hypothetical protein